MNITHMMRGTGTACGCTDTMVTVSTSYALVDCGLCLLVVLTGSAAIR